MLIKFIAFLCIAGADLAQDLSLGSHHRYLSMTAVQSGFHRGKELSKPVTPLGNMGSGAKLF